MLCMTFVLFFLSRFLFDVFFFFFFFSSRRRHTRSLCDWSSDVCSSDLLGMLPQPLRCLLLCALPGAVHRTGKTVAGGACRGAAEPRAAARRLVRSRHAASAHRRAHRRRRARHARALHGEGLDAGGAAVPAHRQPRRHERRRDDDPIDRGEDMKATLNGIATYYEIHGKEGAPWLTFSHSLACSARMWDGQIAAFKDRYRILVYDTRGHGQSMAPGGPYTLDALGEDLRALLKHLDIARTHFVGLSMGGMIGQIVALKDRALFERLVLADTGP